MMRRYDGRSPEQRAAGTTDAIAAARRGELVVVNADGAYVIITDAFSDRGVERIRTLKQRPDMSIPVFVGRPDTVDGISPMLGGAGRVARSLMAACWPAVSPSPRRRTYNRWPANMPTPPCSRMPPYRLGSLSEGRTSWASWAPPNSSSSCCC